jgi:hypothetical protein
MLKVQGIMLPFSFRFPMLGEHRRWSQKPAATTLIVAISRRCKNRMLENVDHSLSRREFLGMTAAS